MITTVQLADVIRRAIPKKRYQRIHPATRAFQSLRILVNDELNQLAEAIPQWVHWLRPGGRMAIISYHSLEDGLVKNAFRTLAQSGLVEIVTKKPTVPGADEICANRRARSAKLRVAKRTI